MSELLSVAEVATRYKVRIETVRRWLHANKLYGFKVGLKWRIPVEALEDFINRSGNHDS